MATVTPLSENSEFNEKYEKTVGEILDKIKEEANRLWVEVYPNHENKMFEQVLQAAIVVDVSMRFRKEMHR